MPLKKIHKRPYLLLEALIAFALVALCIIPLIYPHVGMLKAERQFVRTVELDHVVNLLYADVLEKLYLNKIGFNDLFQNSHPVDEAMLKGIGYTKPFHFIGSYTFIDKKHKPKQEGPYGLYLVQLKFAFLPKELVNKKEYINNDEQFKKDNTLQYEYEIFLVRDQRPPGASAGQTQQGGPSGSKPAQAQGSNGSSKKRGSKGGTASGGGP